MGKYYIGLFHVSEDVDHFKAIHMFMRGGWCQIPIPFGISGNWCEDEKNNCIEKLKQPIAKYLLLWFECIWTPDWLFNQKQCYILN